MTTTETEQTRAQAQSTLIGRWTYRSFVSNPNIDADFASLEFGRGELIVEYLCGGKFIGRLVFDTTYQFRLEGVAAPGDPPTIKFRGIGDAEASKDQIYDYFGCVMPLWSYNTRQRLTIVGSVVRAVPHNGNAAPAGQAACFIAVKRDVPQPTPPGSGGDQPGGDQPGGDQPGGDQPGGDQPGGGEEPTTGTEEGSGGGKRSRR